MKFKNAFRYTEHSDSMMAFWDHNLVCRFANSAYLKWFGFSPEDMVDQVTLPQLLGPIYEKNRPYIMNALRGEVQVFERELTQTDGSIHNTLATYTPEIIDGKVTGFFVHVVDITFVSPPRSGLHAKSTSYAKQSAIDVRLKNAEQLIRKSLFSEFPGIDNLAKECFISPTKLKRDFKVIYKLSPFSYYRNLQMQIADKYLKENLYSKRQIADMLGFANQSNFISCYKKHIKNPFPDK